MYHVTVKASHRWTSARVGGRVFSKHGLDLPAAAMTAEIRNSPLLDVMVMPSSEAAPDATDQARELAEERGLDLADITGTGEGGRVLLRDVRAALGSVSNDP